MHKNRHKRLKFLNSGTSLVHVSPPCTLQGAERSPMRLFERENAPEACVHRELGCTCPAKFPKSGGEAGRG